MEIGTHAHAHTVLKTYFKKEAPKVISYCDYRHFSNVPFHTELNVMISFQDINNISYDKLMKYLCFQSINML